jgi:c-di-GMP-related signal transduction protein
MSVPLRLILKELNLSTDVTNALLERRGILGELLNITKAIENFETDIIRGFIKQYKLAVAPFLKLMSDTALK